VRLDASAGDLVLEAGSVVSDGKGGVAEAVAQEPRLRPTPEHGLQEKGTLILIDLGKSEFQIGSKRNL
jgi:hypothetical protein